MYADRIIQNEMTSFFRDVGGKVLFPPVTYEPVLVL